MVIFISICRDNDKEVVESNEEAAKCEASETAKDSGVCHFVNCQCLIFYLFLCKMNNQQYDHLFLSRNGKVTCLFPILLSWIGYLFHLVQKLEFDSIH